MGFTKEDERNRLAQYFWLLANDARVAIIARLGLGEATTRELQMSDVPPRAINKGLQILRAAGAIRSVGRGRHRLGHGHTGLIELLEVAKKRKSLIS